jgi:hypothetical protein
MAKFQKFNPVSHLHGLALAARALQAEELGRIRSDQDISFPFGSNAPSDKGATIPKKPARRKWRVN